MPTSVRRPELRGNEKERDAELGLGRKLFPTSIERRDDVERRVRRKPTLFGFPSFENDVELNDVWIQAQGFPHMSSVMDKSLKCDLERKQVILLSFECSWTREVNFFW